jgi:hypothetical protein
MHTGSYLQVWYPGGGRWVTVAVADNRAVAARFAADAFRERHNTRGELPTRVRIVSATQLVYEGGEQEVCIADADVIGSSTRDGTTERRQAARRTRRRAPTEAERAPD